MHGKQVYSGGSGECRLWPQRENCAVDRIVLQGMSFSGRHGARPAEWEQAQEFKVDVELETDLSEAGRTDQLGDTVDYSQVRAIAQAIIDATVEALRLGDEVRLEIRREQRGHAGGTRVIVETHGRFERTLPDLRDAITGAEIPNEVKRAAVGALERLGRAEARLHGLPESKVHLHELGGADTMVDLVAAFWLLRDLNVAQVYASELPAPSGRAGQMPLPAPASMRVLEGTGAIFRASDETRELVTPTGAAILAVAAKFTRPAMSLQSIGYGIGARDVPGNALAVWIGAEVASETGVALIETNIDDMAPTLL